MGYKRFFASADTKAASWDTSANETAAWGHDSWGQEEKKETPPPADAWAGSWGGDGGGTQEDWKQEPPQAKEFCETQAWNKSSGTLSAIPDWQQEKDDWELFMSRSGDNARIDFDRY